MIQGFTELQKCVHCPLNKTRREKGGPYGFLSGTWVVAAKDKRGESGKMARLRLHGPRRPRICASHVHARQGSGGGGYPYRRAHWRSGARECKPAPLPLAHAQGSKSLFAVSQRRGGEKPD